MTQELTTQERIDRGFRAKEVLDNPTVQKVFVGVRDHLIASLEASSMGDRETHHEIALSLQALRSVQRLLQNWVTDGDIEQRRK